MLLTLLLSACAHDPDPAAGAEKYDLFCSSCHGADGTAGVQVDGVAATDLAVTASLDDATLATVIQDGYLAMPPQQLDDDETADVIAYLRETFGG